MDYHQIRIRPEELDAKYHWYFKIQSDHVILARKLDLAIINKKKKKLASSRLCCSSRPLS